MNELELDLSQCPENLKEHILHLERMRRDFVANVSHELRTPLTVIRGYLETLTIQKTVDQNTLQDIYSQLLSHSIRMEKIINDLLLLSRLENNENITQVKEKIDLSSLITTLYHNLGKLSEIKQQITTLNLEENLEIFGYPDDLKSLFSNLISNAIKYTKKQGEIHISCKKQHNQIIFQVSDTGIGLHEKDIPRITERFYRVDKARSRDSGGTGLGLAIAKHVLIRHQAKLNITSKLNQGSTFSCIFNI